MAERTIKIGILGTGAAARAHAENFLQVPGCEVVAVSSRQKDRACAFIAELGLRNAVGYGRLSSLLTHPDLDVVSICTPHPNHPAETIACAEAGKHIIIEKPVALDRKRLKEMVAAVKKAGVLTSVCFELHWIGLFRNIEAIVKKGLLGNVYYGEASYFHGIGPHVGQYGWNIQKKMAGDALLTAGCHALDGLIHLMGSRVVEVAAMSNTSPKNPWKFGYDPNTVAILRFESGAIGKVGTSIECRQPYLFPIVLIGDRGSVRDDQLYSLDFPAQKGWGRIPGDLPESGDAEDHPYKGQFAEFFDHIRRRKNPHNDLAAAAHVHEVIFAIAEATKTRRTVKVPKAR